MCLKNRLKVPNKIELFTSSAPNPLVVKSGTKLTWYKVELNQQKYLKGLL